MYVHICHSGCEDASDSVSGMLSMQNPLEWPPRDITTQPTVTIAPVDGQSKREAEAIQAKQEAQALQKWLTTLQEWIREHACTYLTPALQD